MFIDEEYGNLIIAHINQKKKSDLLQLHIGVHSAKNIGGESGIVGTFIVAAHI